MLFLFFSQTVFHFCSQIAYVIQIRTHPEDHLVEVVNVSSLNPFIYSAGGQEAAELDVYIQPEKVFVQFSALMEGTRSVVLEGIGFT